MTSRDLPPQLDEVFARFNLKKDQKLSADEIFEMLVALRMPHQPREIIRFLLSADKDGDQLVTLKDFRIYVRRPRPSKHHVALRSSRQRQGRATTARADPRSRPCGVRCTRSRWVTASRRMPRWSRRWGRGES